MSGPYDCQHRPPCPPGTPRWICYQRTEIERGIWRGLFTYADARQLLQKYGLPITPAPRGR